MGCVLGDPPTASQILNGTDMDEIPTFLAWETKRRRERCRETRDLRGALHKRHRKPPKAGSLTWTQQRTPQRRKIKIRGWVEIFRDLKIFLFTFLRFCRFLPSKYSAVFNISAIKNELIFLRSCLRVYNIYTCKQENTNLVRLLEVLCEFSTNLVRELNSN